MPDEEFEHFALKVAVAEGLARQVFEVEQVGTRLPTI
jgi:hypothetical protein